MHGACAASSEKHYSAEWEPPLCLFVLSRKSSETVSLVLSRLTYGFHQNVLRAAIKSKTCAEVVFWWWLAVVLKSRSSGKDRVASPTTAPVSKLQKINYTPVLSCSIKLHHTGKHCECVWSTANTHTGAVLLIRRGCCGLKAHQKCLLLNLPFFLKLFLSPCDLPTSWKSNARILGSPMLSFLFSPDKAWTRLATLSGFCEVHWKRCTRERSKQIEPYIPNYQEFSQFCRVACHICREGEWALCALLWLQEHSWCSQASLLSGLGSWCLLGSVRCEGGLQNASVLLPAWALSGAGHPWWWGGATSLLSSRLWDMSRAAVSLQAAPPGAAAMLEKMTKMSHKLSSEISSNGNEFGPNSSVMPACFTSPQRSITKIGSLGAAVRTWQSLQTLPDITHPTVQQPK